MTSQVYEFLVDGVVSRCRFYPKCPAGDECRSGLTRADDDTDPTTSETTTFAFEFRTGPCVDECRARAHAEAGLDAD